MPSSSVPPNCYSFPNARLFRMKITKSRFALLAAGLLAAGIAQAAAAPSIDHITTAGAFGGYAAVASPGSWIEIYGSNLAGTTRAWATSDFNGSAAPTALDGVSVTIGGAAGYISYVSPGQINVNLPDSISSGPIPVVVSYQGQSSAAATIAIRPQQPGLLAPASFLVNGKQYVTAIHSSSGSYVGNGSVPNVPAAPAVAGEILTLYGIGFGSVKSPPVGGAVASGQNALASSFSITIGGATATVQYAGLAPGAVALYQFNVVVPANLQAGDALVQFALNGSPVALQSLYLPISGSTIQTVAPGTPGAPGSPGAPTNLTSKVGGGSVSISFSPPASAGTTEIIGYTAQCGGASAVATGISTGSPVVVYGLSASTTYTCVVFATNYAGTGTTSAAIAVTPVAAAPGAPEDLLSSAGNGSVSISFATPVSNGGAAITGYTATCAGGGATAIGTSASSPVVVTGLTNGTTYNCVVTATNSAGTSTASASVIVIPAAGGVPGVPTNVSATAGNAYATIAFTAPASAGVSPVTGYTATCTAGSVSKTGTGAGSPFLVTGLVNGTTYSCAVAATNGAGSGAPSAGVGVTPALNVSSTYTTLWIPDTITGTTFNLTLGQGSRQLRPGAATNTYSYNGAGFWGPTLIMNQGDFVQMNVTNALTEETTTHWHGFHIPAVMDGGPHQPIAPGETWSPSFQVANNASTYWYHPHMHETTAEQISYGAGGFIIIKDPVEAALPLPRNYGIDDIPLVFTSRRFLPGGNQFNTNASVTVYGDYMLTNGTMNAQVTLPAQFVRLRLLNAEIERAYNFGFSDNRTFYVIGNDGGLLNAPVPVTRLVMFAGERVEILVDLTKDTPGSQLNLLSFNGGQYFGFPGGEPGTNGTFGSLLNNTTFNVLHINVIAPTGNAVTSLPKTLVNNTYLTLADATRTRTIHITDKGPGTPFTFDNQSYAMAAIGQTVSLGTTEAWTIVNGPTFSHAFHIHDVQFKIVSRSSGPVGAYEQGWKDTVEVPLGQSVTFVAKFTDFADPVNPYMYHCHFSDHEDGGMMGQFLVVP